ncbi:MAG: radical SAM protein [Acutalibacteraceae bacterium]|nr:radical SAM protein [Oscillospiraceae bacterium]
MKMICKACPRECSADRSVSRGFCRMPENFVVARAAKHFWEEPCISGTNGSGTVFFSGCSLRCVFCQNHEISAENFGKEISDERLMRIFDELIAQGAHNINLVNPTHYAERLARVLKEYNSSVPVVYNSGGYEKVETLKKLEGLIDIYLPDLKYISPDRSLKYSGAENYFDFAAPAIKEMIRQTGSPVLDENGIMLKGTVVRHLILPKNTNQSVKIIEWLSENIPRDTYISLMAQYTPVIHSEKYPELNRGITRREYDKVLDALENSGFYNCFVQEMQSSGDEYIPKFDLSGV